MIEIYKDVSGYEGLYEVSNLGNVRSLKYGKTRVLKPGKDTAGYLFVILCKDGKMKKHRVHRLVAQAFIPNPYNLPEINHKDEDKTNNVVTNLEYCNHAYNMTYGTLQERKAEAQRGIYNNPKLSKKPIQLTLDYVFVKEWESTRECGRNGFNQGNVSECCNGKRKTYKGYRWMYAEDYYNLVNLQ